MTKLQRYSVVSTENNNQTIYKKIFCQKSSDLLSSLSIPSHDANDDDNDDPDDDWRICQDIPGSLVVEGGGEVNNEKRARKTRDEVELGVKQWEQ